MKLDEALEQLDAISAVANRGATFQGLRAFPTALTSVIAVAAALLQSSSLRESADPLLGYLMLWITVAGLALVIVLADMVIRYHRDPTARARRMTIEVLARLAPAIVVGAALTAIVFVSAPEVAWMLPGFWSLLLGLGIFAASSLLPRSLQQVGIWYISCGLVVLILARAETRRSVPWSWRSHLAAGSVWPLC